jgi:hypothetical protein
VSGEKGTGKVGGTCSTRGRGKGFDGKARRKETTWKTKAEMEGWDQNGSREISWGSVDWIQLAQDRDRWRALVNTLINLRVLAPLS